MHKDHSSHMDNVAFVLFLNFKVECHGLPWLGRFNFQILISLKNREEFFLIIVILILKYPLHI